MIESINRYKVVCNDKNNKFSFSIFFSYFSSLASHRLLAQAISRICQFQTFMRITLFLYAKTKLCPTTD